jgi:hypothetical protein
MKNIFLIAAIALFSCADENKTEGGNESVHATAIDTLPVGIKPILLAGCYAIQNGKDSASLSIELRDSTVSGNLVYLLHEKDSNRGTIKGVLRDSLIYADYTFSSEGMTSVREVIFKVQPDQLLEATGDRTEQAGRIVYTKSTALNFSVMPPFRKVACQ